jgi:4-diphosphocytidyl-2-C-methyl-D-erythritol kinase
MKHPLPTACSASLSLKAPAKINWFLEIAGKREDGYHDIISLMQCVNLHDDLLFEHAESVDVVSDLRIPVQDNLAYKAAALLKEHTSYGRGARIHIRKSIPVSAGLGGGSSDAAYTLSGLNMLWKLGLRNEDLISLGAQIGSDVPFFFQGPVALVEGKGEKVKSVRVHSSLVMLFVKPPVKVSSAWAYNAFDQHHTSKLTKKSIDIKLFCQALDGRDFISLGDMLRNDLEEIVMKEYPAVREIKMRLSEMGALVSAMSGSGPTVFGVFQTRDGAEKAAEKMRSQWCRVVETLI